MGGTLRSEGAVHPEPRSPLDPREALGGPVSPGAPATRRAVWPGGRAGAGGGEPGAPPRQRAPPVGEEGLRRADHWRRSAAAAVGAGDRGSEQRRRCLRSVPRPARAVARRPPPAAGAAALLLALPVLPLAGKTAKDIKEPPREPQKG